MVYYKNARAVRADKNTLKFRNTPTKWPKAELANKKLNKQRHIAAEKFFQRNNDEKIYYLEPSIFFNHYFFL